VLDSDNLIWELTSWGRVSRLHLGETWLTSRHIIIPLPP
jgi:hypothetical protein